MPGPADPERTRRGLDDWLSAAAEVEDPAVGVEARALMHDPAARRMLDAMVGHSPFLTRCLVSLPDLPHRLARQGPDQVLDATLGGLADVDRQDRASVMTRLRRARREAAVTIAMADLGGLWPLERITAALSRFADSAVDTALAHLLRGLAADGAIALGDDRHPGRDSGLAILALGKLGAEELNYSSDIDIMVLFDPERLRWQGTGHPQAALVRLVRDLVTIMQERTNDGYVLRTDLRLRPDPAATPVAISIEAAELYYESLGQNWERAALIKARAAAGDRNVGRDILARLTPFIWRKHLDFAAIQDIHSIKRQINARHGGHRIAVAGHNIKVGRGGIREIEFFAQTQQLIWGGRDPSLRQRGTCAALRALAAAGRTEPAAVAELIDAYRSLRTIEHRLQMIDDRQTQTLPNDPEKLAELAAFVGHADLPAFADSLVATLGIVEARYAALFEEAPALSPTGNLVFTGTEDDPETLATLAGMGFADCAAVAGAIRGWHHGRYRAMRSTRARELLTEITPTLLGALARTAQPDAALMHFDEFLRKLPAGVQLFSLFYSRPGLLDLVATIMGTAPRLAEHLSHNVSLLDGVLSADFDAPLPDADALTATLDGALAATRDEQDLLDTCRRWAHDRQFQVGVQMLRRAVTVERGHAMLSDVAEAVLRALAPRIERHFAAAHGRIAGGRMAILALGKLGAREMTATSDLDLVFIYESAPGADASDGAKPLPPSQYYTRLSQRLLTALSALTAEGRLFEIDMRLRPSGAKGPVASEIDGFLRYQGDEAWLWEHMALTRARLLCGPTDLGDRLIAGIDRVLRRPRDPIWLAGEVDAMRRRIAAEHGTGDPWDVKHVRGGQVDIDFIAQYVQLRDAATVPRILAPATVRALELAGESGALAREDAAALIAAALMFQRVQGLLRLTLGDRSPGGVAPQELRNLLAAATGTGDHDSLARNLAETQADISVRYERIVGSAP